MAELTSKFYDDLEEASEELSDLDIDAETVSETITDALCDVPGALFGDYTEFDDQVEAAIACGYGANAEFFWCEDPDCPVERDNMMLIEEKNEGKVEFQGEIYYLYEDPDWESGTVHAVAASTVPADDASYAAVLLHIHKSTDDNNTIIVTSVEDSDDYYYGY